jgi:hypothetical protein
MIDVIQAMAIALVAGMAGQFFPLWADVDLPVRVKGEIFH